MNDILTRFDDLTKVVDTDLSLLSDDELQNLFNQAENDKNYYHNMEQVVKLLANSLYGAMGSPFFRFYNANVAGDITTEGKMFMFNVDNTINNYFRQWASDTDFHEQIKTKFPGHNYIFKNISKQMDICVYGDTDSRYINFGEVFKHCNFTSKSIDEACEFILFLWKNKLDILVKENLAKDITERNGDLGYMIMELESIAGKGIFLAKKKYIMSKFWDDGKYVYHKGDIKAVGVEINQASTSEFVKKSIKIVLKKLLTPGSTTKEIYTIGTRLVNFAKSAPIDEIVLSQGIGDYNKWVVDDINYPQWISGTNANVKAAIIYNQHLHKYNLVEDFPKYRIGKIKWYYALNEWGIFGVPDGVNIEDLPHHPEIDYNKQIDKLIITPLKRYIFSTDIDKDSFGQKEVIMSFRNL